MLLQVRKFAEAVLSEFWKVEYFQRWRRYFMSILVAQVYSTVMDDVRKLIIPDDEDSEERVASQVCSCYQH